MEIPKSTVAEMIWPGIPNQAGAMLMAIQWQLEQSQWLSTQELQSLQLRQLEPLLKHATGTVPYYRTRLPASGITPGEPLTMDNWLKIPLLKRETIQDHGDDLLSTDMPEHHGEIFEKKTSGSTGRQMILKDTDANNLYWMAITLRDHLWHRRRFSGGMVSIRSGRSDDDPMKVTSADSWGESAGYIFETGPSSVFYHTMPIPNQAELLLKLRPEYLLVYPSNAMRLAEYFRVKNLMLPSLRGVITYGELLLPEARIDCQDVWGVPVHDMYSCEEVGYMALQCPDHEHYHCQSESVLVEVLDPDGQPCGPGEVGRVVLTSIHNFAMPLIRYENLDHAEVGEPCPCGRGGLVLKRLRGRERNMAFGIDGQRFWPEVSRSTWSVIDGIKELQLVQVATDRMEVRLVGPSNLAQSQEEQLTGILRDALGQPYSFAYHCQDEITRHANGKYERFICRIGD